MRHHDPELLRLFGDDIHRQGRLIEEQIPLLREAAEAAVSDLPPNPPGVYLIGCGDSLDGGAASRPVWEHLFPHSVIDAVPAMTFSSYTVDRAPPGSLVVALSQSGKVSRVIEAVRAARKKGLATVAITARADSPLAHEAVDGAMVVPFPKLGSIPGTTSYVAGSIAFSELACALAPGIGSGEVQGAINKVPKSVDLAVAATSDAAVAQATRATRETRFLALAAGPMVAAARHLVRKVLETSQLVAMWQEIEEYAHDEYSLVSDEFLVILFAPDDRSITRTLEVSHYLRRLNVDLGVITTPNHAASFSDNANAVYVVDSPPLVAPLVASVPPQILAHALANNLGGSMYGMGEEIHRMDGDPQIYESAIIIE
jgi:fructoselysine-6-P-deglycase FrlB-like protein